MFIKLSEQEVSFLKVLKIPLLNVCVFCLLVVESIELMMRFVMKLKITSSIITVTAVVSRFIFDRC